MLRADVNLLRWSNNQRAQYRKTAPNAGFAAECLRCLLCSTGVRLIPSGSLVRELLPEIDPIVGRVLVDFD